MVEFYQEECVLPSGIPVTTVASGVSLDYHPDVSLSLPPFSQTITSNGDKEMLEFLLQELELVVLGSDALANAVLKVYGVALIPVNLNTR